MSKKNKNQTEEGPIKEVKYLGLLGEAGTGKDTAGKIIQSLVPNTYTIALAEPIKAILSQTFGLSSDQLYGKNKESPLVDFPELRCPICHTPQAIDLNDGRAECVSTTCGTIGDKKAFDSFWTVRQMMQFVGTDCFRKIDDKIWIKLANRKIQNLLTNPLIKKPQLIVVTDLRFENECDLILDKGGEVWGIQRSNLLPSHHHISEAGQKYIPTDKIYTSFLNNGTEDELKEAIKLELARFMEK